MTSSSSAPLTISLLDYGAGNVRSVRNALTACGYSVIDISTPDQILSAQVIVFPGVGSYHSAMTVLASRGWEEPLKQYLAENRPYLGICLGMQTLFECSMENSEGDIAKDEVRGLGVLPGNIVKFDSSVRSVPHIGWNGVIPHQSSPVLRYLENSDGRNDNSSVEEKQVYFVHSYFAPLVTNESDSSTWVLTRTTYEGQEFVSSVQRGNVVATQFHPEKSGGVGLDFLKGFLEVSYYIVMPFH